jgi:arsenite methyltransferase
MNNPSSANQETADIRDAVREGYGTIARGGGSCCGPSKSCCGGGDDAPGTLAQTIGYDPDDLDALPDGANLGLSCGNPVALASLKPGETVLDLGSGAGFDVFIAGRKVGPEGRVIGVDMTADMLSRARANAATYREQTGLDNVAFRLGEIEHLPLADNSVDVVISNCVINLSPDKPQVWREIARVLRPLGRVAVSDLALRKPLPGAVASMVEALVGCIAGAALVDDTRRMAEEAGLVSVELIEKPGYVEAMTATNDPLYEKIVAALPEGESPADYVVSLETRARRPPQCACG